MNKKGIAVILMGVVLACLLVLGWRTSKSGTFANLLSKTRSEPLTVSNGSAEANENSQMRSTLNSEATIVVNGKDIDLKSNSLGAFPRVVVPANANIPIQLKLTPNMAAQLVALDGGGFENKANAQALVVDQDGNLRFQYQIHKEPGNYRVAVNYRGQRLTFNFWVGPPLTPRVGP